MCLEDEVEKIGLGYIFPAFGMEWNVKIDRWFEFETSFYLSQMEIPLKYLRFLRKFLKLLHFA